MSSVSFLLSISTDLTLHVQNTDGFDACKPIYLHVHPASSGVLNMGQAVKKGVHAQCQREGWNSNLFLSREQILSHTEISFAGRISNNPGWVCVQGPDAHLKWIKPNRESVWVVLAWSDSVFTTASWCFCEMDNLVPEGWAAILVISKRSSCTLWQ